MLVLLVLAAPFSAQALDCTGLDTLVCSGPTLQGTIGLPPEADYTTCGDTFPHHYKLYNVALVIFHKLSPPISTVFLPPSADLTFSTKLQDVHHDSSFFF